MSGNKIKYAYFDFSRGITVIPQLKKENNQKLTTFYTNVALGLGETSLVTIKV